MESKSIVGSQYSLGFFGVINQSLKVTTRIWKQLLPIILIAFLSYSLIEYTQNYRQTPVFVLDLANHPNTLHNIGSNLDLVTYRGAFDELVEFLLVKLLNLFLSLIPTLCFLIITVSICYEAYTYTYAPKVLDTKERFLKSIRSWQRTCITSLCMVLITLGIICVYTLYYGIVTFMPVNSWSIMFFGVISLSIPICYCYVAALCMVSLVVSVLEEGFSGFKAIGRAVELMKGKRLQAPLMMIPFVVVSAIIYHLVYVLQNQNLSSSARMAIGIPSTSGSDCLLKLFMFVMYTVFYYEQKVYLDEKEVRDILLP